MATGNKCWEESQLKNYNLPLEEVPRFHCTDPRIDDYIADNKPVVIIGSNLVKSANKWSLSYLQTNIGDGYFTVYSSKTHNFKYYDDKKIPNCNGKFVPPTKKLSVKFEEFVSRLKQWKPNDEVLYLQETLNNTIGPEVVRDFLNFDWKYCTAKQSKHNWGPLTLNLLLIGMEGNISPCHYDEQENLFAQVHGCKHCILFSPDKFECLYPYPVHHPHDRQSQVDFDNPDHNKFPKFRDVSGLQTVVGPGDVLYIPKYWWHHIESLKGGLSLTVNFWYKSHRNATINYPLLGHQKVSIMRNVEKMVLDVLQDPEDVAPLFRAMVLARYTD